MGKTMIWRFAALLMAVSAPLLAHELGDRLNTTAGQRYSQGYIQCYDDTYRGRDRLGCTQNEMARQNVLLNRSYKLAMNRAGKMRRSELRKAQREWIVRRDRKCRSYEAAAGLTEPADESGNPWCILDETIHRTIWLERQH